MERDGYLVIGAMESLGALARSLNRNGICAPCIYQLKESRQLSAIGGQLSATVA